MSKSNTDTHLLSEQQCTDYFIKKNASQRDLRLAHKQAKGYDKDIKINKVSLSRILGE